MARSAASATFPEYIVALQAIAAANPSFNESGNWTGDPCDNAWTGIYCENDGSDDDLYWVDSLDLGSSGLRGVIPRELKLLSSLTGLYLYGNNLTGSIPRELGELSLLKVLSLYSNSLTGTIPRELGALEDLWVLALNANNLTGAIPSELGGLYRLEELYLSSNLLDGTIPEELGNLSSLMRMDLSSNRLTGGIPLAATGWPTETVLTNNYLNGSVPGVVVDSNFHIGLNCFNMNASHVYEVGQRDPGLCSAYYPELNCSCVPPEAVGIDGSCYCVRPLRFVATFSCNRRESLGNFSASLLDTMRQFAGPLGVPYEQIAPLTFSDNGKRIVTISINILPPSGALTFTNFRRDAIVRQASFVNRSKNKSVMVPFFNPGPNSLVEEQLVFASLTTASPLPFSPAPASLLPLSSAQSKASFDIKIVATAVGTSVILVVTIVLAVWLRRCRMSRPVSLTIEDTHVKKWSLAEVRAATNNFDDACRIGRGGFATVYKAAFEDVTLAVKRLSSCSQVVQAYDDFVMEVKTVGNIHNRNLLGLQGYCIEGGECLLMYDYMVNGSLQDYMFGEARGHPLDWSQCVNILEGTAHGLAYLHEGCKEKIIHRDIKPANILLDENLVAHVADFGLVRSTGVADTHVSTRVAGTFGYLAPEYAYSGQLTEKSDVFSFGVLMLVVIGHRPAIDKSGKEEPVGILEWAYAAAAEGRLPDLVSTHFCGVHDEEQAKRLISISLLCTQPTWQERPSMGHVVQMLNGNIGTPVVDINGIVLQSLVLPPFTLWSSSQDPSKASAPSSSGSWRNEGSGLGLRILEV